MVANLTLEEGEQGLPALVDPIRSGPEMSWNIACRKFRRIFRVPEYSERSIRINSEADGIRSAEPLSSEYSCQLIWPQ